MRSAYHTSQHARNEKTVHEDRGLLHRIVRSAPLPGLQPLNAQTGVLHQNLAPTATTDNCRVTTLLVTLFWGILGWGPVKCLASEQGAGGYPAAHVVLGFLIGFWMV
jgi:hypothetical protein